MVSHPTLPDSSDPARKLRFKCPSPVRACQLRCATTRDRIATHASCAQRRRSVRARFFMPPICEAVAAPQAGGRAPRWPTYSVGSARSAPRMAPTPSSSTSLAVQAMAMRAAQRLTGLLSVSLFLQTAFVCDPRRRVVLIFVCVGVVTACCSVMGLGDDRSSASICSCTAVIGIFFYFYYFSLEKGNNICELWQSHKNVTLFSSSATKWSL